MSKNSFKVKKGLTLTPVDPTTITDPEVGDLIVDSTDGDKFKKYDGAAFAEVTGSGGGINYIENSGFESDTSGWTGDTNLVISRITSGQLRGDASLQIAKAAADASTEQVYVDFTVETADLAKKLIISFDYDASDANYSDGDMKVIIIQDPSGTPVTIRPNGEDLMAGKGTHIAQFQTDATETEYRLVIEQDSTQALAVNIIIDDVKVGPQVITRGTIVTDWEDYTPTVVGLGTITVINARHRRVGSNVEVDFRITGGTHTATNVTLSLPNNLQYINNNYNKVGSFGSTSSPFSGNMITYDAGDNNVLYLTPTTSNVLAGANGTTWTNGTQFTGFLSVPIQGWSSNAKMSEDFGGRDIYVEASGNDNEQILTSEDIPFKNIIKDTTGSWTNAGNTGNNTADAFVVPETGYYDIDMNLRVSANLQLQVHLYIDGSLADRKTSTAAYISHNNSWTAYYLTKGQVVTFRADSTITLYNDTIYSRLKISKRSSPQTILETETVAARYTTGSAQVLSNAAWTTILYDDTSLKGSLDTHGIYNTTTGEGTVPYSGLYHISARAMMNVFNSNSGYFQLALWVNGSPIEDDFDRLLTGPYSSRRLSTTVQLEKGDTFQIRAYQTNGAGRSLYNVSRNNTISIARIK